PCLLSFPTRRASDLEYAAVGERLHAGVLGAGEYVRVAELDGVEGVLAEQIHAEAGIAVQLALLFVVEGVQFLIDDLQGGAHGHGDRKSTRLNSSHVS